MSWALGLVTGLTHLLPSLPLFFWRPTRGLAFWVLMGFGLFSYLNYPYLLGQIAPFHDTRANHLRVLYLATQWLSQGYGLGWNPYLGGGQPWAVLNNFFLFSPSLVYGLTLHGFGLERLL
ncbi:MAG: hypothetical protein A2527_04285 [Candidatus Lambdaproteobacteria bacterium RIFOXYD2_FULL_50_16]|uniref:Uncharacterized protein n=1 Tax=Candidatus Lambdaproteobacteria bacterium RIFOXYD2_FULL_50_16 TaxID=1817772 RepID=A0A1F6G4D2_9PROT|nr:MAG: hypothetical protein A2527_04285 [Candidatus Lambdaproteobacteria bacterium RIFOXYD2_FULL_50_16]